MAEKAKVASEVQRPDNALLFVAGRGLWRWCSTGSSSTALWRVGALVSVVGVLQARLVRAWPLLAMLEGFWLCPGPVLYWGHPPGVVPA